MKTKKAGRYSKKRVYVEKGLLEMMYTALLEAENLIISQNNGVCLRSVVNAIKKLEGK